MLQPEVGYIGLGKMGMRMVSRLLKNYKVFAYDIDPSKINEVKAIGAIGVKSLKELVENITHPRLIWIMIPTGKPIDDTINGLFSYLDKGDVLIDGGNSFFKDSIKRSSRLSESGIFFLDVGTSGGLKGAEEGACLTVGGSPEAYRKAEYLLKYIARPNGLLYCGPSGAGHYVKMIHNGIEYALLQAFGEGFEMIHSGPYKIELEDIAMVWSNGSTIRSYLLELSTNAFKKHPCLENVIGEVEGGETGRWMIETAIENEIPTPSIALSLLMRYISRQKNSFSSRFISALRGEFGGHPIKTK